MAIVDLAVATHDTLTRMLRRLPSSLWNTSPDDATLQRDLYQAFASQMAIWLEQREIARTMSLLLEAQGVDLDVLLQDYGLRRYLQRPDPFARQIGMQILWYPQGTLYSVARLADLLFDLPHATLRTGRSQQHVFVAATHPVTTPHSYWGLVSAEGLWYAVTVDGLVPTISQVAPPGVDVSPGPHSLSWFTVRDEVNTPWYVSVRGDTLRLETTAPAGYGTTEPFAVLDGQGQRWFLQARASDTSLVSVLDTGLPGFGYWRLQDPLGTVYALWIEAHVPTFATTPPGGSTDQTPGGTPLAWLGVLDELGTLWYLLIEHTTLVAQHTNPGGTGSTVPVELLDVTNQLWALTVNSGSEAPVTTALSPHTAPLVVVAPDAPFQAFRLSDSATVVWWISVDAGALRTSTAFPFGAVDVTAPGGPFHWLRLYDLAGTLWYCWPSTAGVLQVSTVNPGGFGTAQPQMLGDLDGVLWHLGVDPDGDLTISDAPALDYAGMATAVCLTDATGGRWFWRVHGHVLEWSAVLWPDTLDQSPWGELGWLQILNEDSAVRYVFPTTLGDPFCTLAPPSTNPWGWSASVTFLDDAGTPWHLTALRDDRVGVLPDVPPASIPQPATALPLAEALEALGHVQAAGSTLTLLVT